MFGVVVFVVVVVQVVAIAAWMVWRLADGANLQQLLNDLRWRAPCLKLSNSLSQKLPVVEILNEPQVCQKRAYLAPNEDRIGGVARNAVTLFHAADLTDFAIC